MTKKVRLDQLLVARELVESRETAKRLIMAGAVSVRQRRDLKPGQLVAEDVDIDIDTPPRFVGRGGEKLEAAFKAFDLDVNGASCLDIGASTGGFTDCLLQHGASRVAAVDVGKGQLHWRLRRDPRVVCIEGVNARYLERKDLPWTPSVVTVDVSFISLTKILPAVIRVLDTPGRVVTLIKPQFEAGRAEVGRGGVVRDEAVRDRVVGDIHRYGVEVAGLTWVGCVRSPLLGPAGNVEFVAFWEWRGGVEPLEEM